MQYLNPYSGDLTEIGYKEKLKKYLEAVLISDETAARIRAAFDAYIFLSYRKKDRRLANELMRLIHSRSELQDVAVWYDEFLTPGESFKENIDRMLHDSKLFALLVTPNLLEEPDGKPNYVMAVEYPEAKRIADETGNLSIIPTEINEPDGVKPVDKNILNTKFPGLPECVNANNEGFLPMLISALNKLIIRGNDNDPTHKYLIGLAYLGGIDVEVDKEKAVELISFAGENGVVDAAKDLVRMYYSGMYFDRDLLKADYWQKK